MSATTVAPEIESLVTFLTENDSLVVLSGAGVSTASGIPDYRDRSGEWKHAKPIQFDEFKRNATARKRYWSRSFIGWQRFSQARPNAAHRALAALELSGKVEMLITQNVDGLHGKAGSCNVMDLHGNLSKVRCLDCDTTYGRAQFQMELRAANPYWHADVFRYEPDGDAVLAEESHRNFSVSGCAACGGVIKPDVVMFGESVPKARVQRAFSAIDRAAALLIVGSSLMVFSGFRFARHASARQLPIAIVNQGRTRADDMATLKVSQECGTVLSQALKLLSV
jgi:NAD-dependent SIR2 family protein deacetylase